jgi:hypothetical protein
MGKKEKDKPEGVGGLPPEEPKEPAGVDEPAEEIADVAQGPVLVTASRISTGSTFEYGGSQYRVVSNRILIEDIKTGSRGEIAPGTLVKEV